MGPDNAGGMTAIERDAVSGESKARCLHPQDQQRARIKPGPDCPGGHLGDLPDRQRPFLALRSTSRT